MSHVAGTSSGAVGTGPSISHQHNLPGLGRGRRQAKLLTMGQQDLWPVRGRKAGSVADKLQVWVKRGPQSFPGDPVVKNLPTNAGHTKDTGLIPGSGNSPGVGNGN